MLTNITMLIILLLFFFIFFWGVRKTNDSITFFDKTSTNALRGICCLVVMMVHIPGAHGNRIQDLVSSFGFIAVTIFFMMSGYGLTLSYEKSNIDLYAFWKKRYLKLILMNWLVNAFIILIDLVVGIYEINFRRIVSINPWVLWLIICYFIFMLAHHVSAKYAKIIIGISITIFSLLTYLTGISFTKTIWVYEIYGFLWGMLLAKYFNKIYCFLGENWVKKFLIIVVLTLLCGALYLKFKSVYFWGEYVLKIILGLMFVVLYLSLNAKYVIGNRVATFLGTISFEVYLFHVYAFSLVDYLFPNVNSGIYILIAMMLTVFMAYIIHICANFVQIKWKSHRR